MVKRTVVFFGVFMVGLFLTVLLVYQVSSGTGLAETALRQSTCRLTVMATRGTIYDCDLKPLTGVNTKKEYAAAVVPGIETKEALEKNLSVSEMEKVYDQMSAGRPFTLKLSQKIEAPGIDSFETSQRYSDTQQAVHLLGYLDGSGKGISGIEKAFDLQLHDHQGRITIAYRVDALNRVLGEQEKKISDTSSLKKKGVVLTLDRNIQSIAEKAANKYLSKGAVIVTEVPSCKIRALVSLPGFSPNDVAAVLKDKDSPLLNRALSAYSVGSVFKLVSASAALEYGISTDYKYTCTGSINVDGNVFHCYNSESHGEETMKEAVANSCNTYFINLMQQVPPAQFLLMTQSMGFGRSFEIAPGLFSDAGVIPSLKSLKVPSALANFSFGQGELTATPLQISAMVNAIASGGKFTVPTVYQGQVDEKLCYTEREGETEGKQVMSRKTAELVQSFMQASIEAGTSKKGKPSCAGAGAKTATAQTGQFVDGKEKVESWFSGFYPYHQPKYVITVFAEGGDGGGRTCGPVFKQIADELYRYDNEIHDSSATKSD